MQAPIFGLSFKVSTHLVRTNNPRVTTENRDNGIVIIRRKAGNLASARGPSVCGALVPLSSPQSEQYSNGKGKARAALLDERDITTINRIRKSREEVVGPIAQMALQDWQAFVDELVRMGHENQ